MSGGETIRAAIDKLKELRDASSLLPWEIDAPGADFDSRWDYVRVMRAPTAPSEADYDRFIVRDGSYSGDAGGLDSGDANLIVALSRTIDAQLAILEWGAQVHDLKHNQHPSPLERRALGLARAILGDSA